MSGVVDVGDAIELTFSTTPGATVDVSWLSPDQVPVIDAEPVAETPAESGRFPYTLLPTVAGMWTARFTASGTATAVESYFVRASSITGPPPLAAVGDVGSQYGTLTQPQEGLVSWLLRVASSMIRSRYPAIDAQIAAGSLDPDVVAAGVANMILRVLRNPGGLRSETVGPFSRTYDTGQAAGLLVITDFEALMFTVTPAPPPVGVGVIMMRPGLAPVPRGLHSDWRW